MKTQELPLINALATWFDGVRLTKASWRLTRPIVVAWVVCGSVQAAQGVNATTTLYVGRYFEVREHDQPTKYVFNGSTRVAEITGSLSANRRVQRLQLYSGWNLCSVAVSGPFPATGAEAIAAAYQWDSVSGAYSSIALGQGLSAGTVLWIKATSNAVVGVVGTYSDPVAQPLPPGGTYLPGMGLEAWSPALPDATSSWIFNGATGQWLGELAGDLAALSSPPPTLAPGQAIYLQSTAAVSLETPDALLRIRYYHQDHLGSSSVMSDAAGAVVEETSYFPTGLPHNQFRPRPLLEPYQYTQKEGDVESGLYYFGIRYVASQLSCFISPDPKLAELVTYSPDRLEKPQSLNPYAFAARNPVKFLDPDGMDVVWSKAVQQDKSFQRAFAILKKTDEGKRILAALEKADVKVDVGSLPAEKGGDVAGDAHARSTITGGKHKIWRDTTVAITLDLKKAKKQHLTDYELANVLHHELRHAEIANTKEEEPDLPYYSSEESLARDDAKRKAANQQLDQYIPLGGERGQGVQSGDRSNIIFQKEIGLLPKDYGDDWLNKPDADKK